ncbi:MAG: PH domain-containing protein [Anaerohalosphaeraceae bacterium]|nr:PH domain-containing protein [Anaerohalosphaeraceae bacterium]
MSDFENEVPDEPLNELPEDTKRCPYCAELILAAAVKCRYCGEFLSRSEKIGGEFPELHSSVARKQKAADNTVLFESNASGWIAAGAIIKAIMVIAAAGFIALWPIEKILTDYEIEQSVINAIEKYRVLGAVGVTILALLIVVIRVLQIKSIHYEVTPDRVEWSRGIFDRRIDNVDMFRVVDLKLHRSMMDCVLGIGSIVLITKDQTDPEFRFAKLRKSRKLYDIIKTASLDADAKRGVIHLE